MGNFLRSFHNFAAKNKKFDPRNKDFSQVSKPPREKTTYSATKIAVSTAEICRLSHGLLFSFLYYITSAGKDRKAAGDGRIWTQEADDAAISA